MAKAKNNSVKLTGNKSNEQNLSMVGSVKPAQSKAGNGYYKIHLNLAQVQEAIDNAKGTWQTDDGKQMLSLVAFETKAKDGLVIRPQSF